MDPFTASMLISAAPAILQGITGGAQLFKGKKMQRENERPMYEIPTAATEALGNARTFASNRELAGQSFMEQNLDQVLANTNQDILNTASSSTDALGALIGASGRRMEGQTQLDIAGAQDYQRRQMALRQELNNYGDRQDKQWEMNELNPYLDKAATSSALIGGGMENIFGAVNTAAGVGSYAGLTKPFYDNELKSLQPKTLADNQNANTSILASAGTTNVDKPSGAVPKSTQEFMDSLSKNTLLGGGGILPNMGSMYKGKRNPLAATTTQPQDYSNSWDNLFYGGSKNPMSFDYTN